MKTKILLMAGLVALGAFVAFARRGADTNVTKETLAATQTEWLTDFKVAQERARTENKPLLIDFTGSDWCPPCMLLEQQVFSQGEFANYAASHLVLLKVDFPRRKPLPADQQAANDALAQRFGVQGFPTILAMGPDGKLKGQVETSMFNHPSKFIASLEALVRKP